MEKKKKAKGKKIKKLKKEIEEMKEGWQRTQADFDNYRKRIQEELDARRESGKMEIIQEMLPIFDNFERAYKHIPKTEQKKDWVQGLMAIEKQFQSTLKGLGVEKYHLLGKKFDPELADALFYEPSDKKEGIVIEEVEPGYKIGDKILRHARVKVSSGKKKED